MSTILDRFINFLKWPAAIFMLCSSPALINALTYFNFFTQKNFAFLGGILLFFVFRATLDKEVRSSLQTFGHELTHAFFAVITFHKVISIKVHDDGGEMKFKGDGNWLIIVAPYFFPLFFLIAVVLLSLFDYCVEDNFLIYGYYPMLVSFALGVIMGIHLDMIAAQIHDKQTDLKKLGTPFSLMFILPANLMVFESVTAFNSKGWDGFLQYFDLIAILNKSYLNMIF